MRLSAVSIASDSVMCQSNFIETQPKQGSAVSGGSKPAPRFHPSRLRKLPLKNGDECSPNSDNLPGASSGEGVVSLVNNWCTQLLFKGAVFWKHPVGHSMSSRRRREVFLSKSMTRLIWRPVKNLLKEHEQYLDIAAISKVEIGQTFASNTGIQHGTEGIGNRCFSIISGARRLNLEGQSEAIRDDWVQALRWLIHDHVAGRSGSSQHDSQIKINPTQRQSQTTQVPRP